MLEEKRVLTLLACFLIGAMLIGMVVLFKTVSFATSADQVEVAPAWLKEKINNSQIYGRPAVEVLPELSEFYGFDFKR